MCTCIHAGALRRQRPLDFLRTYCRGITLQKKIDFFAMKKAACTSFDAMRLFVSSAAQSKQPFTIHFALPASITVFLIFVSFHRRSDSAPSPGNPRIQLPSSLPLRLRRQPPRGDMESGVPFQTVFQKFSADMGCCEWHFRCQSDTMVSLLHLFAFPDKMYPALLPFRAIRRT